MSTSSIEIKAIIGLGNPGPKFYHTRHNIGFQVVDLLCDKYTCNWQSNDQMSFSQVQINDKNVLLIKPLTFMNSSGLVIPWLKKKCINSENILVVHDELELPFGTIKLKLEGSAKGHNGLKSIISYAGANFYRLRFGIGRPENREDVPNYVLENFSSIEQKQLNNLLDKAVNMILDLF